jgi:hypothetical protein
LSEQKHPPAKAIFTVLTADWFWSLSIVIGAIVVPAPSLGASTVLGLPKLCLFRNITGVACPGCGMTRSLIATGHLHFVDAIAFHPLGPPVLLLLMFYCAAHFMKMGFHKGQLKAIPRSVPIVMTACFVIVWVARLLGFLHTPS